MQIRSAARPVDCPPGTDTRPEWIDRGATLMALVLWALVAYQRHFFTHGGWAGVVAAVAVTPWILGAARRAPPPIAWSAVTVGAVTWLLAARPANIDVAPFLLVFLAGSMATREAPTLSIPLAGLSAAPVVALDLAGRQNGSAIWVFATAMAWFFGALFRRQEALLAALETAQTGLAARAADDERRRLARDIHDLIAHSMSVTLLHITGARLALADGDTQDALDGLAQAETTGREAMTEIRRTVGLLGDPGANDPSAPAPPTAGDVTSLVDGFRAAGMAVEAELPPDLGSLPAGPGLAFYRIVQESLSNASRHAPGRSCRVYAARRGDRLELWVVNELGPSAPAPGSGLGVSGMADRAALCGGTLTAGPSDGRWVVEAVLPWPT